MSEQGTEHKIDDLGRVLISKKVRETMGWNLKDTIIVEPNAEEGTVTLRLVKQAVS